MKTSDLLASGIRRLITSVKLRTLRGLGLQGSKECGESLHGIKILRLSKNGPLGRKGECLYLPKDKVIYKYVLYSGVWEPEESKFLAESLGEIPFEELSCTAVIDIGANTGLITRQLLNETKFLPESIFVFEPMQANFVSLKHNLAKFETQTKVHYNNFALGKINASEKFFTQRDNFGNSSILKEVIPADKRLESVIRVVSTEMYFLEHLKNFCRIVLKCDAQGSDLTILSQIPIEIWSTVKSAVVEAWALDSVLEEDARRICAIFEEFDYFSFNPNSPTNCVADEIYDFWTSRSGESKNIFLKRKT